jgi:hypothetical protein
MAESKMSINKKIQYTNYISVNNRDIFDSINERINGKENGSTVILPHTCTKSNFLCSGFAGILNEKFPIVKQNFDMLSKDAILGKTQFIEVAKNKQYNHTIIVANMIADHNHDRQHSRYINYAALCYCMNAVKFKVKQLNNDSDTQRTEIHCPKFGIGSAGGNWKFISELIEDIWPNINTYVYRK